MNNKATRACDLCQNPHPFMCYECMGLTGELDNDAKEVIASMNSGAILLAGVKRSINGALTPSDFIYV